MTSRAVFLLALALTACGSDGRYQAKIAANFKDPDAVEFRNFKVSGSVVCGEVNAKNSFGAYVGYKPFLADTGAVGSIEPDYGPDARDGLYENFRSLDESNVHACKYQRAYRARLGMQQNDIPQCRWVEDDRRAYAALKAFRHKLNACLNS